MTIAPTLQKYMDERGIRYDLVPHEPTLSALGSTHAGHIPSNRLAKAVVLNDGGRYKLAVLPAQLTFGSWRFSVHDFLRHGYGVVVQSNKGQAPCV